MQTIAYFLNDKGEEIEWRVFFTQSKTLALSIIYQGMKRLNASGVRYRFATHVESNWDVEEFRTITK